MLDTLRDMFGFGAVENGSESPTLQYDNSHGCIGKVKGQEDAKQALLIAAAGSHNLLLIGPPGEGKTHLVSTLPGFLPPLAENEAMSLEAIYSHASLELCNATQRPFREVHHSISQAGLVGGYNRNTKSLSPGEISLAHTGVLFLDELPEFDRGLLDSLRQPMESGLIRVTRSGQSEVFPCRFQLIGAANPCKCGWAGTPACSCSPNAVTRYLNRLSGPIIDRIDMTCRIYPTTAEELRSHDVKDQSLRFAIRVVKARIQQYDRNGFGTCNSMLQLEQLYETMGKEALQYLLGLKDTVRKFSTRRLIRTLRIARTIADLYSLDNVSLAAMHKALEYSQVDLIEEYTAE